MDAAELRAALAALVRDALPEMSGGLWPVRARVVAVHQDGGDESDESPRYTVDVQVLRPDGSDDDAWPVIQQVDLPQIWAGGDVGVWCAPEVDMRVRVAWEYGDRSRPYVETLLGHGGRAPAHPTGTLLVKAGAASVRIERGRAGAQARITLAAPRVLVESGDTQLGAEGGGKVLRVGDLVAFANSLVLTVVGGQAKLAEPMTEAQVTCAEKVRAT